MPKAKYVLLLLAALVSTPSFATTSYTYSKDSRDLYEVVIAEGLNGPDLKPGIYKIDGKKGHVTPLLLGRVNGVNRSYKGILSYQGLNLSYNSPQDIVSVVNGYLTLLNFNSNSRSPGSVLQFGVTGKSGVPVIDMLNGKAITIPPVTELEDIRLLEGTAVRPNSDFPKGSKLYIASIKAPSYLGEGLTFAFVMSGSGTDDKVKVVNNRATLLSYDFMDEITMSRLVADYDGSGSPLLYAPLLINNTKVSLPLDNESRVVRLWGAQLDRFLKYLKTDKSITRQNASAQQLGVPYYDLLNQRAIYLDLPIELVDTETQGNGNIAISYDPFAKKFTLLDTTSLRESISTTAISNSTLYFIEQQLIASATFADEAVDRDPNNGKFEIVEESIIDFNNKNNNAEAVTATYSTKNSFLYFSQGVLKLAARQTNDSKKLAVLPLNVKGAAGDKIAFIVIRTNKIDNRNFSIYLISRQSARAKTSSVTSVVVEETNSLRMISSNQIYEGPFLSPQELFLRTKQHTTDPLFDNVTNTQGVSAYLKDKIPKPNSKGVTITQSTPNDVLKLVPYQRLLIGLGLSDSKSDKEPQRYLKSLVDHTMVDGELFYREYDPNGATQDATGFYLTKKSDENFKDVFLPGSPIFSQKDLQTKRIVHVSDAIRLEFPASHVDSYTPVKVSLFPFIQQSMAGRKKGAEVAAAKTFHMGVAFTPGGDNSSDKISGVLRHFELRYPYLSLAYTKILQGIKNRSDEFHILLFFREDPKIPGSQNVVVVASGKLNRAELSKKNIQIVLNEPVVIHRGVVTPSDYKTHLKMDAEGSYYWEADPSVSAESPKRMVYKLADLSAQRTRITNMMSLRDADHLKDSEVGMTNKGFQRGGVWEVYGRETLKTRVPGMAEQLDTLNKEDDREAKKEAARDKEKDGTTKDGTKAPSKADLAAEHVLIENFETYLDKMLSQPISEQNKLQVILVEPSLKAKFRTAFFKRLARNDGQFSLRSPKFRFFYAENNLDDIEIADELSYITNVPNDRRRLLYVEPELLKSNKVVSRSQLADDGIENEKYSIYADQTIDERDDPKKRFKFDNPEAPASFMTLLASGGRARTVRGWKRLGATAPTLPAIVISTPQEWREIQTAPGNQKDFENGVFDKFDLNFDFLTAAWTMWPPATDRSSDEVKALARLPYNLEEMKVFPTLDNTLEAAAKGQLRGKQTIIIVPPELKPIVQKLILLRWATTDSLAASPWSYTNKSLALFRITAKDTTQMLFQDNFRAIGAAAVTRNAVVISDLETVERIGRPSNPGRRSFSIKDPVKISHDILDETAPEQIVTGPAPTPAAATTEGEEEADAEDLSAAIQDLNQSIEDLNIQLQQLKNNFKTRNIDGDTYKVESTNLQKDLFEFARERDQLAQTLSTMESRAGNQEVRPQEGRLLPHALWWIGAEGKALQPKRTKGWSLKSAVDRKAATILVGTEEELNRLEGDLNSEKKFFTIQDHYDIVRLSPPDEKTKYRLVQALFDRDDVRALQLQFILKNNNDRDPRSQLIYHFFNRVEQIAYDLKMEKTTAFVKAFTVLKSQLTEDLDLRRSRQIDERFIERLFTRVFPMPLNVEILEPHDPLQKLRNVDSAVRGLQKMGYEGSQDLKRRVIENALSQTRPTDTSRPIPNSQIFFGKTSKGKTYLIQTLFKLQDLIEYNPNKASNADADYIFINVAKLTADPTNDPDKIPVSKAIDYILDLMAQPKGARAHIAFDDFHKAISKEVRQQLFQFIQGLFEAKNGMITVRSRDGKVVREIPVQNLNLYMTINPASNEKIRDAFLRPNVNYSTAERLKREVLAAISDQGFQPEESVLARWSDIINIDNFPRSAKVPELGKRIRQHSRGSREMILVEPTVIDALVSQFEDANARELLSPAASALTSIPAAAEKSRLYIVSLRQINGRAPLPADNDGTVNLQELTASVRKITQIDPVSLEEPKSMLRYMAFIMQNFRLQIFNNLALEAHMSDVLRLNRPGMVNLLKTNFLLGVSTHVLDQPQIPEGEMMIHPEQLTYFNRTQTEEFYRHFGAYRNGEKYFPINFGQQEQNEFDLASFLDGHNIQKVAPRTRVEVINQYISKIQTVLIKVMQQYLRLESTNNLRDLSKWHEVEIRDWFGHLTENNPDAQVRALMDDLLNVFLDYQVEFNSPDIVDRNTDNKRQATLYDEVRLFAYMIDRAVTNMPWGTIGKFTYDVVQMSTDFSLGTKTEFKEYIGTHELSPFAITTPEFMADMMGVAQSGQQGAPVHTIPALNASFKSMCESLLSANERSKK